MSFDRMDQKFPALLKSLDGRVLETGMASVSLENGSLDFKSEFVPICKMGTHLQIVRTKNNLEVQVFTGEVYLSTQRMLRIVRVEDKVLYGALSSFLYETELSGVVHAVVADETPARFHLLSRRGGGRTERAFTVKVHALSLGFVRFTLDRSLDEGQQVTIDIGKPLNVRALPIQVEQAVVFGEGVSSYRCRTLELSEANRAGMEWHIAELCIRALKMFPPATGNDSITAAETESP